MRSQVKGTKVPMGATASSSEPAKRRSNANGVLAIEHTGLSPLLEAVAHKTKSLAGAPGGTYPNSSAETKMSQELCRYLWFQAVARKNTIA